MKQPSHQQLWQLKQKALGNCIFCARPAENEGTRCRPCAIKHGIASGKPWKGKVNPPKSAWKSMDWSLSNRAIAEMLGVTVVAVFYQRKKHDSRCASGDKPESGEKLYSYDRAAIVKSLKSQAGL